MSNQDEERQIQELALGALLLGKIEAEQLEPDDFPSKDKQVIVRAAVALRADGQQVNVSTVYERLEQDGTLGDAGGYEFLKTYAARAADDPSNGTGYIGAVRDAAHKRRSLQALQQAIQDVKAGGRLDDQLPKLQKVSTSRSSREALEPTRWAEMIRSLKRESDGRRTGIPALDDKVLIPEGAITLVAGRPGDGKTTVMLNLLRGMIEQDEAAGIEGTYLWFTYEEAWHKLGVKLVLGRSGYVNKSAPHKTYAHAKEMLKQRNDRQKLEAAVEGLQTAAARVEGWLDSERLIFCDMPYPAPDLVRAIRATTRNKAVRGVFVDYIQKVSPGAAATARYLEVGAASEALRAYAVESNLPLIMGAQFNRLAAEKVAAEKAVKPALADIRESGNLEQDAHLVLGLYRPDKPEDGKGSKQENATLLILKNRDGELGEVKITLNLPAFQVTGRQPTKTEGGK